MCFCTFCEFSHSDSVLKLELCDLTKTEFRFVALFVFSQHSGASRRQIKKLQESMLDVTFRHLYEKVTL